MQLNKPVFAVIMFLSIAIAGFAAGSFAGAYILGEPGSEVDPLVAESYLKEAVEKSTDELRGQIIALQEQLEDLRFKLDSLESRVTTVSSPASRSQPEKPKPAEVSNTLPNNAQNKDNTNERVTVLNPESGKTGVVIPDAGANLRMGPSTEFERVTSVAFATRLEIIANRDGWYEVKLADGTKGWILGELIKLD